ncbi:Ig-like domain-containing protein [Streptomyces sp. NPDC001380]|uniref:L,D-transpeptidase n=1 Tax=Streptomyces sp. NPDC001380 TaxID=3364566 RepID=UPI00367605F7
MPPAAPPAPRDWTRRSVLAGLAVAPAALAAACSNGPDGAKGGQSPGASGSAGSPRGSAAPAGTPSASPSSSTPRVSTARIAVDPPDGTRNADSEQGVTVTASGGRLTSVRVADEAGRQVAGTMEAGSTRWRSTAPLHLSTRYTVSATAVDAAKLQAVSNTSFATKAPDHTFVGFFTPEDGSVSGVGMPVSIVFNTPITDRRAVQQAVTVEADPPVEVVGHWFDATRLDFRPRHYWAAGTRITLRLRLRDVRGAKGVYGVQSKDVHFTIGRSQVSTVDLATGRMTVRRDGRTSAVYEVTGGSPQHPTWEGVMVVSERYPQTRMNSRTVGLGGEYDIPDVPHAQRLTTSGTFIHGNYWSPPSVFGHENVSHGCIGLRDTKGGRDPNTPGAEFYGSSMVGDVVEVVRSGDRTVAPANGLNGWNLSWADWKAGSSL